MSFLRLVGIGLWCCTIIVGVAVFQPQKVHAVACGGSCAVYACTSPLLCSPTTYSPARICGLKYNRCIGATCHGDVANAGYDTTAPCNQVNLCTPGDGSTRTASWVANGSCSVTCGVGTQEKVCTCGTQNTCPATCTKEAGGAAACNATEAQTCCIDQLPQVKPVVTSAGLGSCSKNDPMVVTWTYADTGSTCGSSWGYKCGGNTNTFTIKVDGVVHTSNLGSDLRSASISTSIATSHDIQVCASNGFGELCSNSFPVTIDVSAPPQPGDNIQFVGDPACVGKLRAVYSWNSVTDEGCAGLHAESFWAQASTNSGFSTVLSDWVNTWGNTTTQSSVQSYVPGTQLYFHVQSRDMLDNQSGWTATRTATVPTPSPYPTIHISGSYIEEIDYACYPGMTIDPNALTLAPVANPSTGVTIDCNEKTSTGYGCNIAIDNTTGLCVNPNVEITMNVSYAGYAPGYKANNRCGGITVNPDLTAGDNATLPLYFVFGDEGGAGSDTGGWFKLSNTSFQSRLNGRQNYLPSTLVAYDSDDSITNNYMMIGTTVGSLLQDSPVIVGPPDTPYSQNNWHTNGYRYLDTITYSRYIDYIEARKKDVHPITSLSEITEDGIYTISSPITLSSTEFNGKKIVLLVQDASATIATNFVPENASVALLAKNVVIDPSVSEINAILVGETITTGESSTGLKIRGNLVDESALIIQRAQTDARKPSLFIVFDIKNYVDLLPYLSTSTYEWKQIQ